MSDISYSNMLEMLKDCLSEVQKSAAKMKVPGISSGFGNLDGLMCGFEPGKVYVIGARPGMGKMAFVLSMIRGITLGDKVPVLLFSTNHLKSSYIYKLLSIHCGVSTLQLQKGWMKPQEWGMLDDEALELVKAPLFIHDSLELPLDELLETAHCCISEKGIKIIFIDCLQMIDFANADGTPSERVAKVMGALKQLAYETKIPIVVGAMMNRRVEHREGIDGKRPQLGDMANSCFIEELADVVMMVHRPEYYKIFEDERGGNMRGLMEIIVMKNDLRPSGSVFLDYQQETGLVSQKDATIASRPVPQIDFRMRNKTVKKLIKTFGLEEDMPF